MTALEAIEVPLRSGVVIRVVCDQVIGGFAIHPRIWANEARHGDGWSVTHKATGFLVWVTEKREDAVKIATWLHENKVMPAGKDEIKVWCDQRTIAQNTDLNRKMTAVCPRYYPKEPL